MGKTAKTKTPKQQKPPKPTRADLIDEALDYRKQGHGAPEIAAAMGLKLDEVNQLIREGLENVSLEDSRLTALLEIHRLQDAQKAIATNVANGEPEALRLMRQLERDIAEAKVRLDPQMREIFGNAALFEMGKVWTRGGSKRKNGRPPHQPTVATVAQVKALVIAGQSQGTIAKILGVAENTLRQHYAQVMDIAKAHTLGMIAGSVVEGATKDPRLGLEILSRQGVEGFKAPMHTPTGGKNSKGDEYTPAAGTDGVMREVVHRVEVIGGLPRGSTPERPEGDDYSDVPPEEERK